MQRGGESPSIEQRVSLYTLLNEALPDVYHYLLRRCGQRDLAEDLTSETFLAPITSNRARAVEPSVAWLIGVACHKLADHWRRQALEDRRLSVVAGSVSEVVVSDDEIDAGRADEVLERLSPTHRAALTWRYVDGLSVPEVAELVGRSVHATETLLMRAKAAFRRAHAELVGDDHV